MHGHHKKTIEALKHHPFYEKHIRCFFSRYKLVQKFVDHLKMSNLSNLARDAPLRPALVIYGGTASLLVWQPRWDSEAVEGGESR